MNSPRTLFLVVSLAVLVCALALAVGLSRMAPSAPGEAWPESVRFVLMLLACLSVIGVGWWLMSFDRSPREALRDRLRILLEVAPDAALVCRQDRKILMANEAAARLFGFKLKELPGRSLEELIPNLFAGQTSSLGSQDTLFKSPSSAWRISLGADNLIGRRKDGSETPIEVSFAPVDADGRRLMVCFIRDIAERKNLEERVQQSQKLEAIGRLAGGVAHDFNNLLTAILGYAELLLHGLPPGDPTREGLEEIKRAAERAASLTQQLLAFGRKQMLQPTVVDLNALVHETQKMLRRLIPEDIEIRLELDPDTQPVRADPTQTQQVLVNLVLNARDAMPRGGTITISTGNDELTRSQVRRLSDVRAGPYAVLTVTDTGCGMDEATLARVFEPFFTTKVQGKGTGLGLATAYGIVKQSGGHIEVESEPGQGTTFRVYLPIAEESIPTVPVAQELTRTPVGTETVLLAEDEAAVRSLLRRTLEQKGYVVLEACNGKEALQLCREHDGPIHVLLTDVVMPHLNGPELARQVQLLHPDVRVIFLSGYADSAVLQRGLDQSQAVFVPKPFRPETIIRMVREVLDRPQSQTA
ncbi:MAG: response regulator [Gemmatales bacterium]|nr:response regulator [Gemmatales bacterium]MDW8385564.1 response regulator [Gemmatales bacterium]